MRFAVLATFVASYALVACAHWRPRPPGATPDAQSEQPATAASSNESGGDVKVSPSPPPVEPPAPPPPTASPSKVPSQATATSATKSKPPSAPRDSGNASSAAKAPPAAQAAQAPALDVASLEQRLKDTRAIGVFTKLSLKNQVDTLLGQLRDFHSGKLPPSLGELRQRYDLLLMKVLSLLQDGDPSLAKAISGSREAIWDILSDPQKFSRI
jgi:hypothetical protein